MLPTCCDPGDMADRRASVDRGPGGDAERAAVDPRRKKWRGIVVYEFVVDAAQQAEQRRRKEQGPAPAHKRQRKARGEM